MNKTQKTLASSTLLVGGYVLVSAVKEWRGCVFDLYERFPDIDHKIIRKAFHREMYNCARGNYGDIQDHTDEQMDEIFLSEVQKLTAKK